VRQISRGRVGELLVGQPFLGPVDGANTVFTTQRKFLRAGGLREAVYLRGLRRLDGSNDYSVAESGGAGTGYDTIIFSVAPKVGDHLTLDYYPAEP